MGSNRGHWDEFRDVGFVRFGPPPLPEAIPDAADEGFLGQGWRVRGLVIWTRFGMKLLPYSLIFLSNGPERPSQTLILFAPLKCFPHPLCLAQGQHGPVHGPCALNYYSNHTLVSASYPCPIFVISFFYYFSFVNFLLFFTFNCF